MCGILVCGTNSAVDKDLQNVISCGLKDEVLYLVNNRGPDGSSKCRVKHYSWTLDFFGSVLWMQGAAPTLQPVKDERNNILLWNGDIFEGSLSVTDSTSDTCKILSDVFGHSPSDEEILKSLSSIKGPYSFVYWNASMQKLWFGRDRIGRHSLLLHAEENCQFMLTSVGKSGLPLTEIPVVGIFVMDFHEDFYSLNLYPWSDISEEELPLMLNLPVPVNITKEAIDSPIVTRIPLPYEPTEKYLQILESCNRSCIFDELLSCDVISGHVEQVLHCLRKAVKLRTLTQPGKCRNCVLQKINRTIYPDTDVECSHPKIGILFSGGLDSSIVAALAHEYIPLDSPIDLFNVAFESGSRNTGNGIQSRGSCPQFCTPDRATGIQSSEELNTIFPNRQWNFIQINVLKEELDKFRRTRIRDLIYPLESVLDDSLGCALWFASRLSGALNDTQYESPVRVLLLGMGADEQFGGYMRHRTILRHKGWAELGAEMKMELQRIAVRNLGRDDRVVADHGCQARFPFLDEDLINCISSIPVWARCYPTAELPPGIGDKLLLRLVAWKLGLRNASMFPKRAFQFGSRIANGKEKASDVSSRLKS